MHILHARFLNFVFLFFVAAALLASYISQLAEANAYLGYQVFSVDIPYFIQTSFSLALVAILMPRRIERPSNLFALFYALFVLAPYCVLHSIRSATDSIDYFVFFSSLALPLLITNLISLHAPSLRLPSLIGQNLLIGLILCFSLVGVTLALLYAPESAGFDLESVYERRIDGRSILPTRSALAYVNSMIANGLAPFLAFYAGLRKKLWLLIISALIELAYFYILGLKAPMLFLGLAFAIGCCIQYKKLHLLSKGIKITIIAAFFASFLELLALDYSWVGDYFIRRAFSVPPYVASAYFEFMGSDWPISWGAISGIRAEEPISIVVGEMFLGYPGLNANTNAFLYSLAAGGIPMYILTIILVAAIFAVLDGVYRCKRAPALLYLGFSYSILIVEQAATTALVSSGVGLLLALTVLSRSDKEDLALRKAP